MFNLDRFDQTRAVVPAPALAAYALDVEATARSLLAGLRGSAIPANDAGRLADQAHRLAGCAGLFGLERLAAAAGAMERAICHAAPDADQLAELLCRTIILSLPFLQCETADTHSVGR